MRINIKVAYTTLSLAFSCAAAATTNTRGGSQRSRRNLSGTPRIRREWRMLTQDERQDVADAFWTMKNIKDDEGKQLYGSKFANYDDLVLRHACSVYDPGCDMGHVSPAFMTFHRAFLLAFENSLRAINPSIEGLPYWDVALDNEHNGIYYKNPDKWIFSNNFFGSYNGDPNNNYQVSDGLFANWPIEEYSTERYSHLNSRCIEEGWFTGYTATTCDRCCGVEDCECTDQDEYKTWTRAHDECSPSFVRNGETEESNRVGGKYEIQFTQEDFTICADPTFIKSWDQWLRCSDFSDNSCLSRWGDEVVDFLKTTNATVASMPGNQDAKDRTIAELDALTYECKIEGIYKDPDGNEHRVNAHHGGAHFRFGGELDDVATSPNDPLFWSYHANVDRNNMHWQYNTKDTLEDVYWYFPADMNDLGISTVDDFASWNGPYSMNSYAACYWNSYQPGATYNEYDTHFLTPWYEGTTLGDEVTKNYPFTDIFDTAPANGNGYTHQEVLDNTKPETTSYTYDSLEHHYSS